MVSRFRLFKPLTVFAFYFIFFSVGFSQNAKTFLYRITGNGLIKPSYLYGTIHLRDSRLFNFQDSLYSYIRQCDVFANEVDPDSMTGRVIDYQNRKVKRVTLGDQLSPEALARVKKKYQYLSAYPIEYYTINELIAKAGDYFSRKESKDNMVTFMDMYLMGLAKDWGKQIKGLEKVDDQIAMFDKLIVGRDPEALLDAALAKKKQSDALVKAYLSTDLQTIALYVAALPSEMEAIFLSDRNKVMLQSMEAIMPSASLFAAVGAAHLPGTQGLVQLLRDKGYIVTPELSPGRTHAKNFFTESPGHVDTWVKNLVERDGYEVMMPGTPAKNFIAESGSEMYTYVDWQSGEQYFSMHMTSGVKINDDNRDSILLSILNNIAENGKKIIKEEPVNVNEFNGMEMTIEAPDKNFYRTCILQKADDIILLMMVAPDKYTLSGPKAVRFLSSIKYIPKKMEPFKMVSDADHAFTFSMPGNPSMEDNENDGENVAYKQYYSKQGPHEFLTLVTYCNAGFAFPDDSLTMEKYRENILADMDTLLTTNQGTFEGIYPFHELTMVNKEEKILRAKLVMRGNRFYLQYYSVNKDDYREDVADTFMNSFAFLPYEKISLKYRELDSLSLLVPDTTIVYASNYYTVDSSIMQFYVKPISSTVTLFSKQINPLAWGATDSAFLHTTLITEMEEKNYQHHRIQYLEQNGYPAIDMEFQYPQSHQYIKWRFVKAGDRLFKLAFQYDPAFPADQVYPIFDSFMVKKEYPDFDVTKGSAQNIFATLDTSGVDGFRTILEDFDALPFSRNDIDFLFAKAAIKHPGDTLGYPTLENAIWSKIEELTDSADLDMIVGKWQKVDSTLGYQSHLLTLLAEWESRESLDALKKLYPELQEKKSRTGQIFSRLSRNKETVAGFFPDWYQMLDHLTLGPPVLYLHLLARDSGWIESDPEGYAAMVLGLGEKMYGYFTTKEAEDYLIYADDVLTALGKLGLPEANALLTKMANAFTDDEYLIYQAVELLLENNEKPVDAIRYLSEKPIWRSSLYSLLVKKEQASLFPKRYLTQRDFAESYLFDYMEDYYPDTLEYIGNRKLKYEGKDYLFYLFKAGFEDENGLNYYLGVSGPFDTNGKTVELPEDVSEVAGLLEEKYSKSKVDKQLKAFIKGFESYDLPPMVENMILKEK
jgi:uncharacterized protein YbaP (TraB family)